MSDGLCVQLYVGVAVHRPRSPAVSPLKSVSGHAWLP